MPTNRSRNEEEEMLNHLLVKIVESFGATITGNDRNTLLNDWLTALRG